jgi:Ca2+/H+ antiporter, TMEM165/GDT1 family
MKPPTKGNLMDWRILISTFGAVFVAELGDKTQLATLSMSAGATSKWSVFVGSAVALCLTSAIAVVAGGLVSRVISPLWLRRIAGGIFIVLGATFLLTRGD